MRSRNYDCTSQIQKNPSHKQLINRNEQLCLRNQEITKKITKTIPKIVGVQFIQYGRHHLDDTQMKNALREPEFVSNKAQKHQKKYGNKYDGLIQIDRPKIKSNGIKKSNKKLVQQKSIFPYQYNTLRKNRKKYEEDKIRKKQKLLEKQQYKNVRIQCQRDFKTKPPYLMETTSETDQNFSSIQSFQ